MSDQHPAPDAVAATSPSLSSDAFIGVHDGRLIYVIVKDRTAFDAIALAVTDHGMKPGGHCLTKHMGDEPGTARAQPELIFQHWVRL